MASPYTAEAVGIVLIGRAIPAHDETMDLAEAIGQKLDEFRNYIESVRSAEQADEAVKELLTAFLEVDNVEPTNPTKA
jgi:hypothetical protein